MAHNEDRNNKTPEPNSEPSEAEAEVSEPVAKAEAVYGAVGPVPRAGPAPARSSRRLTTTTTYNFDSDALLGAGNFGRVYAATEEGSDTAGKVQ